MTINKRLTYLHNRHRGERVVLVANGPSLNSMDLSFLRQEYVIGLNKIYLGFKKFRFYPRYYVAVNARVIAQSVSEIKKMNCVKFLSNHRTGDLIQEDGLTYHIDTTNPPHRFCRDITQGLHEGWTVTHAALQVAYYLGFTTVIIIGLDHRFKFSGSPNEANVMNGADMNHFCKDYFGFGKEWDNPDLAHSEESFSIARQEFERDGRKIIDATVNGACPVFKKADYRDIYRISA